MGIDAITAEFLLAEHRYKPTRGKMLSLARQTITLTPPEALALLEQTGTPRRTNAECKTDTKTMHFFTEKNLIADESFYSLFCDARLVVLDQSDYEKPDIIHDMSLPVPKRLECQYDFVIIGSSLDNIFNPVTALQNVARMLKPGGRIFLLEAGNSLPTAYLKFSPD